MKLSYLVSERQLESVWQLIEVLSPLFQQSFVAIFNQLFLVTTSGEVGYSAMGLKLPDNIVYGGHRKVTKVSADGFVALRLSMIGYNLVSDLRQFSGVLFFLHAHCRTHSDTKQQNDSFSLFKLVE